MFHKKSNEQFLEDAISVHGHKYKYNFIEGFINSNNSLLVTCVKHNNTFPIILKCHLRSPYGSCKECRNEQYQAEFIKKGKEKYSDKFDYTLVKYTNATSKVNIKCNIHDFMFPTTPVNHLQKNGGCTKCKSESLHNLKGKGVEQFITEAKQTHGDKYDYSKVVYINTDTPVIIICKIHGEFPQRPDCHINREQNCPDCAIIENGINLRLTKEEFVKKCIQRFGDIYDYSDSIYTGGINRIIIKCKKHGYFTARTASLHYIDGVGCPNCSGTGYSKVQITWVEYEAFKNNIYIRHALNSNEYRIPDSRYSVDGYCKETNTVYEFHGDYYHGNPKIYYSDVLNTKMNKTMGELYKKTQLKKEYIISLGYNYIEMWENDWMKMIRVVKKLQRKWKRIYKNRCFTCYADKYIKV
jgi:hypothetical protein